MGFWTKDVEVEVLGYPLLAMVARIHSGTFQNAILENAEPCHGLSRVFYLTARPKSTEAHLPKYLLNDIFVTTPLKKVQEQTKYKEM